MKKKFLITTLALCLSFSCLTACGSKPEPEPTATEESNDKKTDDKDKDKTSKKDKDTEDAKANESAEYTFTDMKQTMVCNIETAAVYTQPTDESSIFTFVKKDNTVEVINKCNETEYYGITINGETGYIKCEYLSEQTETPTEETTQSSETTNSDKNNNNNSGNGSGINKHGEQTTDAPAPSNSNTGNNNNQANNNNNSNQQQQVTVKTPTTSVTGCNKTLYTLTTYDTNSAYFYYVLGEESLSAYTECVSTAQAQLNAQKCPYWQVTKTGELGTFDGKKIAVALCETFVSANDYTTNKTTRATKMSSNQSIYQN